MAISVNTNVTSLNAQRNLSKSGAALSQSMERLSSGMRINSAKDDAAGMQISTRLTSQISGLGVAQRNANDGISMAQTAEGALQSSTDILQRMRDLSLQSSNGSNSTSDREALQKEVTALQSELTRISDTTTFGGQKLLSGSYGTQQFQVGSDSNQTIGVTLNSAAASDIGLIGKGIDIAAITGFSGASTTAKTFASTDTLTMTVGGESKNIDLTTGMSAADLAGQVNGAEGVFGVSAKTQVAVGGFGTTNTTATDVVTLNVAGVEISATAGTTGDATVTALNTAIDAATAEALAAKGITASIVAATGDAGDDLLVFTNANGENIDVTLEIAGGATDGLAGTVSAFDGAAIIAGGTTTTAGISTTSSATSTVTGRLDYTNATIDISKGTAALTAGGTLGGAGAATVDTTTSLTSIADLDISTAGGSQSAIDVIDAALQQIGNERAELGATQNRFSQTIGNLANIQENASASRSRIQDTDYATETAAMTKNQILQQAGTSILAQANQLPQAALSLIG
ncbi:MULTISPECIES: flagellin [unclassified Colwellia]|uniref:flagellin n=2 Tax=Colwellia TaxID=28228 RepID=UPI0015F50C8F|nr:MULTISPECIES: flagellin [unclassified Colwellia]MBA6379043.1 flagellin [Colwellia sp. BRX10-7]MBA6400108.1 flagellin [Colwellia sp. BRX10-5]MBA6403987.1 flagellin [Colwellia sp. BRX10-1]